MDTILTMALVWGFLILVCVFLYYRKEKRRLEKNRQEFDRVLQDMKREWSDLVEKRKGNSNDG